MRIRDSPPPHDNYYLVSMWIPLTGADKSVGTYSPKGKSLGSHMVGWINLAHMDTVTMIMWFIGGGVHRKSTTLNIIFSVIIVTFSMTLLMNKWTNIVMDDGWVHLLAKTLPSLVSHFWWNIVMDDWKLDEKSLGKWQWLQHCKFVIPPQKKFTRNNK
jgi:hypothetical protein